MAGQPDHDLDLTRRGFLGAAAASAVTLSASRLWAAAGESRADLEEAISKLEYLTPQDQFCKFVREKPRVDQFSPEKFRQVGLHPDTWRLHVIADPDSNSKVDHPLVNDSALTFPRLMQLAERHAVRFLAAMTCTNGADPFGMGLWEGVPLREIIWLAGPSANVRRVFYYGYHNDDEKQRFQSSLPIGRALEDPPGELPPILCYKVNGQWLSPKAGGPVRMVVPGVYGNKSVKWLQRIVLTNSYQANDTYALWNNDVESPMKTYARFGRMPSKAKAGRSIPLVGVAQVGMSGLAKVQYSICPESQPLPSDDPWCTKLDWHDAEILPPPANWGGGLPGGKLPPIPLQFDPATNQPRTWPLRYTLAHWAALLPVPRPGTYHLRCRTLDSNGIAQPLPRPFPKAGANGIHKVTLTVEA